MVSTDTGVHMTTLAWIYIGIASLWTVVFTCVVAFLWRHRRLPHLKMRRLPLVFTAMALLHLYGILCYVAFALGIHFPCIIEFWDMNILLPLGIAVFQISNSQFLHVASQQQKYTSAQGLDELMKGRRPSAIDGSCSSMWQRITRRLKDYDQITRMVVYVIVGMVLQIIVSFVIFMISEKFHPSFGLLPAGFAGTDAQIRLSCARGWEWWLSIVWQFFWAWVYAPYILWKSRKIDDSHGWRTQTILCCIAGLPASPLWLCALYVDGFDPVNAVWVAPQWFVLSITLIEAFTLLIPCYNVYKQHNLTTDTLAAIASWEAKNKFGTLETDSTKVQGSSDHGFHTCSNSERGLIISKSHKTEDGSVSSRKSGMYTMIALEHALKWNAEPLQRFAALKDFSGENISFLTHLSNWHKAWPKAGSNEEPTEQQLRGQFNRGVRLYAAFVAADHAEFPINISSSALKRLDDVFAGPAKLLFSDTRSESTYNSATPFEMDNLKSTRVEVAGMPRKSNDSFRPDDVWYWGEIPAIFGRDVFVDAEKSIKYLVLTNTWPKFVNAGHADQLRDREDKSLNSRISELLPWGEGRHTRTWSA